MPWYAAHTNARAEWQAHKRLREQGYDTLYLHFRGTIRHARKMIGVLKPLFPRYLFVAVAEGQSLYAVNTTPGVSTVVYLGADPLEVPERVIAELRARGDATGLTEPPPGEGERRRFEVGEMVRIADPASVFHGLLATVVLDSGDALRVWLDMFGGQVAAQIDPAGVKITSPAGGTVAEPVPIAPLTRRRR